MEQLFLRIVNISLVASWLVLAVIILRLFLKKSPKWITCLMWGTVALRLVFPFSIESTWSMIPSAKPLPDDFTYTAHPYVDSGIQAVDQVINPIVVSSLEADTVAVSANPTQIVAFIFSRVWILGMALMIAYACISSLILKSKLRTATLLYKGVKQSERVSSPFVLGIFRPMIYIPYKMDEKNIDYVLEHEKAHIKRRDYIWKPIAFIILSVYWFNPVLWLAYIFLCKDIEAACDEKVIQNMDIESRRAYSTALLECSIKKKMITACPVAFGENGVKTRIKDVMNYKRPSFWIICISVIACVVVAILFLTNPKRGDVKLLENASPATSSMEFYRFDGEKTEVKRLYDEADEKVIIEEINRLITKKCDSERIVDITPTCYGIEISDNEGYMIWLTYSNGLWLQKDGTIYEASYDFERLYSLLPDDNYDTFEGGIAMTNAGLLAEFDIRYCSRALEVNNEKRGVSLSITNIDKNIITVLIENNTEEDFIYGTYYSLQKEIDGIWYNLPVKYSNYGFTDIAFILSQGDSQEEKCDTTMYGKLSDGHYRIEKEGMVAEFYVQENTPYIVSEGVSDNVVIPDATNEEAKTYTKWEDFEFDCWPLALGQLRDEWSEESPYWQFVADKGTPVYAVKDGAAYGGYNYDDGYYFILELDDMPDTVVKYSHLETIYYENPCIITAGTEIGTVGATGRATGPFLKIEILRDAHFEVSSLVDIGEENMGVSYRENPITHEYTVDGDMVLKYKKYLVGKDATALHSTQYIVLTNDEDVTWEQVHRSLISSNSADWLYGTIIIGINSVD